MRTAIANRYRIERALGAGGMATVYLALPVFGRWALGVPVMRALPVTEDLIAALRLPGAQIS